MVTSDRRCFRDSEPSRAQQERIGRTYFTIFGDSAYNEQRYVEGIRNRALKQIERQLEVLVRGLYKDSHIDDIRLCKLIFGGAGS